MRRGLILISIVAISIFYSTSGRSQNIAEVDFSITHQLIEGFGASTAWHGQISEKEADAAFSNKEGQLGLNILRVRIDPGGQARWGEELANAKKAYARGAIIMASPWSPPASMKSNNKTVGGYLLESEYANYVDHLNRFIDYFETNGVPVAAMSIQNEPNIKVDYESCDWTPSQILTFCRDYAMDIKADVIAPEAYNFDFAYSDPVLNDSVAASHVAIVGGHIYGTNPKLYQNAVDKEKRIWMTEYFLDPDDISTSLTMAKGILDCMHHRMNAYIWWYIRQPGCNLITSGGNSIKKKGYAMAHFSKFVRPGYFKTEATYSPQAAVNLVSFVGDEEVIVVINRAASAKTQKISVKNSNSKYFKKYLTSASQNLKSEETVEVVDGSFTLTLEPSTLITLVGTNTVGVDKMKSDFDFKLYPNPSEKGSFTLNVPSEQFSFPMKISIHDMAGKLVFERNSSERSIDLNTDLSPSVYMVTITDGYKIKTQKLVVY
jgi:glucuronoarabinoxylan endo-1,4-beta-xylanase